MIANDLVMSAAIILTVNYVGWDSSNFAKYVIRTIVAGNQDIISLEIKTFWAFIQREIRTLAGK